MINFFGKELAVEVVLSFYFFDGFSCCLACQITDIDNLFFMSFPALFTERKSNFILFHRFPTNQTRIWIHGYIFRRANIINIISWCGKLFRLLSHWSHHNPSNSITIWISMNSSVSTRTWVLHQSYRTINTISSDHQRWKTKLRLAGVLRRWKCSWGWFTIIFYEVLFCVCFIQWNSEFLFG